MSDLRHHFGQARCGTVNTHRSTSIQQRGGERTSSCAPKHGAPPARPCRSGSPRKRSETPCVLAQARSLRNCAVSVEKRPPTSPASTTSRALPPLPASSGYVVSLSRRACLRAIPFTSCALGRGVQDTRNIVIDPHTVVRKRHVTQ